MWGGEAGGGEAGGGEAGGGVGWVVKQGVG